MSHLQPENETPVRASDAEREQAAELLRSGYADGRLTRDELDQRLAAGYAAKTRADLRGLTGDLPGAAAAPVTGPLPAGLPLLRPEQGAGMRPDWCLLVCLLVVFPPAGIAYLILTARRQAPPGSGPKQPARPAPHARPDRARNPVRFSVVLPATGRLLGRLVPPTR
jgi:hypothetical protein